MRFSKYNVYIKTKDEGILIYNTLYNKVIKLTNKYYKKVDFNTPKNCSQDVLQFLTANSFVVDDIRENEFLNLSEKSFIEQISTTLFMTLIPSFACNFNCPYCYENHNNNEKLKTEDYFKIVDYINDVGINKINLQLFGGEPLLFLTDIYCFLDKLKCNGVSINGGITTNGYLLTTDVFNKLLEYGFTSFQVTIDGDPDCHNATRRLLNGAGTYSTIIKNLIEVSTRKGDFSIIVRCNVSNKTNIGKFLYDYVNYFGSDNRFSLLLFPVSNWNDAIECSSLISRKEVFKRYTKRLKQLHINDAYVNLYLNNVLCCDFSFPMSFALMPNSKINFCTINFDRTKEINISDYFNNYKNVFQSKLLNRCKEKDCVLYPKCFGFKCHKENKKIYCKNMVDDIKQFLLEYF